MLQAVGAPSAAHRSNDSINSISVADHLEENVSGGVRAED